MIPIWPLAVIALGYALLKAIEIIQNLTRIESRMPRLSKELPLRELIRLLPQPILLENEPKFAANPQYLATKTSFLQKNCDRYQVAREHLMAEVEYCLSRIRRLDDEFEQAMLAMESVNSSDV